MLGHKGLLVLDKYLFHALVSLEVFCRVLIIKLLHLVVWQEWVRRTVARVVHFFRIRLVVESNSGSLQFCLIQRMRLSLNLENLHLSFRSYLILNCFLKIIC